MGTCRQSRRRRRVKRLDGEGGSDFDVPKYLVPTSQALGWGAEAVSWIEWLSWTGIGGGVYAVSSEKCTLCTCVARFCACAVSNARTSFGGSD